MFLQQAQITVFGGYALLMGLIGGQWAHAGNNGDPGHPPGITITSSPAVTSWNTTDLHVFARGSDNNVWYNYFHTSNSRGSCGGGWSGWNPVPTGVIPQILDLGYDSGTRGTGWEWGSAQYPQPHPDRLTTVNKNSIQPPSPGPNGTNALGVTLKHGDVYTDHAGNNSTRAEVVLTRNLPWKSSFLFSQNDDVWYHWYTLFPSGSYHPDSGWQVWTQWHQDDSAPLPSDCQIGPGCTPTVEFDVDKGSTLSLRVLGHIYDHDSAKCAATDCGYKWKADLLPKIGQWFDILLHVKWSNDPNVGFMEMYVNHKVLDKSKHFATLDTTSNGLPISVYMKQGLYRNPTIAVDQTIYHDGMQVVKCPSDNLYYHPELKQCTSNPPYS
jgi:Polysaccharide lyase